MFTGGYEDGVGDEVRFNYPYGIVKDVHNPNSVLITDNSNSAIRRVNILTCTVSTILKSDTLDWPSGIIYDPTDNNYLIIATDSTIQRLSLLDSSLDIISGSSDTYGFADGSLTEALYRGCYDIISVHPEVYIVADRYNHRQRISDIHNNKVSSICTGVEAHKDGSVNECQLYYPQSLLLLNNTLYIGTYQRIRALPGKYISLTWKL